MAKVYAVRVGRKPGIYDSWAECQNQTTGFSGAIFKSFTNRKDAEVFMQNTLQDTVKSNDKIAPKYREFESRMLSELSDSENLDLYVDGSFRKGRYSWAFVAYKNGVELFSNCGIGTHEDANTIHNVAGELAAAMRGVVWAYQNGYRKIVVHHDYMGIAAWVTGDWKAKNDITQRYSCMMKKYYEAGIVSFHKVPGHSGIAGNERADQLAAVAFNS